MEAQLENLSKDELLALVKKQYTLLDQTASKIGVLEMAQQKQTAKISHMEQLIRRMRRMLFGASRERFIAKDIVITQQLNLPFEQLQAKVQNPDGEKTVKETVTYTRKKNENHKGRRPLPDNLPSREVIIEPSESTEGMVKIGEERTEILEYAPGRFFKLVIVRPKYARPNNQGILIGDMPSRPIEKCLAGNTLLSSILISKYVDHLPLYRQVQIFKRSGIEIAPSTIDGWVADLGQLLTPLYQAMVDVVRLDGYLQVDETPTRVLDKTKKGKCQLGYYWVYHSPPKRMVVFDYHPGRGKPVPEKMLSNYRGYLQTDGYSVYNEYALKDEIIHLSCWAHARRYFEKALDDDKPRAEHALLCIQKLYDVEREAKPLNPDDRKLLRLDKSLPIINEMSKWIVEQNKQVLPKNPIGKAFNYAINNWDSLMNYLYNGELLIDNNLIENTIRPNALGRKNYLFAGSHQGAQRSAMFYTFTGTCKLHGVDPMAWLSEVLSQIIEHKGNKLYELFPQNLQLPEKITHQINQ